jgi:hypothetical protein
MSDKEGSAICIKNTNQFCVGGSMQITAIDDRWWIRVYYYLFKKGIPTKSEIYTVKSIDSNTTLTIKPYD